uniref:Uncharacterized protein n=1 Tax=Mycena chlorophos TaxID=658473 RepID=A0ABQ0M4D3_MYCCL|nr:predicted protein [Mycena chlorophos]
MVLGREAVWVCFGQYTSPLTQAAVAATWQQDKAVFMRRPSLVRAPTRDPPTPVLRSKTEPVQEPPRLYPIPPTICVQDWSSVEINMDSSDLPRSPELPRAGSASPTPQNQTQADSPSPAQDSDGEKEMEVALVDSPMPTFDPFPSGPYITSALSAVSGDLFDFPEPAYEPTSSTPLPAQPRYRPRLSLLAPVARDSLQPYTDLFDFDMYGRRGSQESLSEPIQLPTVAFADDENGFMEIGTTPIALYSLCGQDTICGAAPSSPKRTPFKSTLNLGMDTTPDGIVWKDESMISYDELSRSEWTEEELFKIFAS